MQQLMSHGSFERGLGALLVVNLLDALFTFLWVQSGLATEANPMMAHLLDQGFFPFLIGKVALVGLGATLLWRLKEVPTARLALVPAASLYALILGQHFGFALTLAIPTLV